MTKITKEELKRSWELAECMRDEGMSDYGNAFNNSEMVLKLHALIDEMRRTIEGLHWCVNTYSDKLDSQQANKFEIMANEVLERYFK